MKNKLKLKIIQRIINKKFEHNNNDYNKRKCNEKLVSEKSGEKFGFELNLEKE